MTFVGWVVMKAVQRRLHMLYSQYSDCVSGERLYERRQGRSTLCILPQSAVVIIDYRLTWLTTIEQDGCSGIWDARAGKSTDGKA